MVLHMHGQSLFARNKAWTSRHGPTFQHAIHLEAKIIVQAAGGVLHADKAASWGIAVIFFLYGISLSPKRLLESAARYGKSPYGQHLKNVADDKLQY